MKQVSILGLSLMMASLSVEASNSVLQSVKTAKAEPVVVEPINYSVGSDEKATSGIEKPEINTYQREAVKPDYTSLTGKFRRKGSTGEVEFDLAKGQLKAQIVELLIEHPAINNVDDIQWEASDNFQWANTFTAKAPSLDHLLEKIMKPYRLLVTFKGNGSVVIRRVK